MIRKLVLRCLVQLENINSQIAPVIDEVIRKNQLSEADRRLLTEIVYGTIRWQGHLDWIIQQFIKPGFRLDLQMSYILRVGVYQLLYLDKIPNHAAINETVELANQKGQKSKNFVNAVLRAIQRSADSLILPQLEVDPILHISLKLSYPKWLVKKWIGQFSPKWALEFCQASNQIAPVSIRTNTLRIDRHKLAMSLRKGGNQVVESRIAPDGLVLTKTNPIRSLREFQAGLFQVQDEAAQLVAHLLAPQEKSEIVDLYFETSMFPELESNPRYSNLKLFQCNNLNNQIDFILLESDAIKFDKLIYSAKNKCQNNKPIDCLREFVDFADVSNNNKLSRAELTRFAKFVVKWLTLRGELQLNERMGAAAATMIIAPALAEFILLNYDYDNDEHIDIKEMTFDIANISGNSELSNKIIRGYIEALDLFSESKINASRMLDDLF